MAAGKFLLCFSCSFSFFFFFFSSSFYFIIKLFFQSPHQKLLLQPVMWFLVHISGVICCWLFRLAKSACDVLLNLNGATNLKSQKAKKKKRKRKTFFLFFKTLKLHKFEKRISWLCREKNPLAIIYLL